MERSFVSFQMMYKSQFPKIDLYDWFVVQGHISCIQLMQLHAAWRDYISGLKLNHGGPQLYRVQLQITPAWKSLVIPKTWIIWSGVFD